MGKVLVEEARAVGCEVELVTLWERTEGLNMVDKNSLLESESRLFLPSSVPVGKFSAS